MILWGCRSLLRTINEVRWPWGNRGWNQIFADDVSLKPWKVPVLQDNFSPAFTIAAVLAIVISFVWWRFLQREKWAELLIEMEAELRKVSWPSPSDAWQSTLVVTGFTVSVVVTILVYDLVIKGFINLFVFA
jgi:preprotein translocase SecE subunit